MVSRAFARPGWLGLILAGGAAGTALRAALESAFGAPAGQWPWATLAINLIGAFVLAALLEALAQSGADEGWRRAVRLGVGTGLLGGFTTYSTLSVETVQLITHGRWAAAALYAGSTVVGGFLAALLALWLVRSVRRPARAGAAR